MTNTHAQTSTIHTSTVHIHGYPRYRRYRGYPLLVLILSLVCAFFALVALLHNLYRTERGSKDGYLGGDWWAEQIAMSTALTVWIIRRLVSPPLHANLEKMLEASERKARKGKKQK